MNSLFLNGLVIGFSIAAPVGPIGALCIKRSLVDGRQAGFVSGLGAATADGMYGLIAALGLTAVTELLVGQQFWFGLIGGLFLCYLGYKTLTAPPISNSTPVERVSLRNAFLSTFALTLTNPMTILSFIAVFAGLGVAATGEGILSPFLVVSGVFLGSALWWLILSGIAGWSRERLQTSALRYINYLSGGVILIFGILAIVRAFS